MRQDDTFNQSRRSFLASGAGFGAFVIATYLAPRAAFAAKMTDPPMPNAFIGISFDSIVTVTIKHLEMGQGIATGLTTIVAEEMDADWDQMRFASAPSNVVLYNNLFYGMQGTGGSTSIANSWLQLRKAGAAMRAMLVSAASEFWNVPSSEVTVSRGKIIHSASGRSQPFGTLASRAASLPVPADVKLKDPAKFSLVGGAVARLDVPDKTVGKAIYGLDAKRPGKMTALIKRAPRFGAKVKSFDAEQARKSPGVADIVAIPSGIAVIAKDTWSAIKGRDLVSVDWDFSEAENRSSDAMMDEYRKIGRTPGLLAAERGDVSQAMAAASRIVEAEYEFPYLAHAPMEPLNALIERSADGVAIWTGSQAQTLDQKAVARVLSLQPDQVRINTTLAGGSFGRRSDPRSDYMVELANILKATSVRAPIHYVRTREDDMTAGMYRSMAFHRMRTGLNAAGQIVAWDHTIVGKSIVMGTAYEPFVVKNGVDITSVHGVADTEYSIPNFRVTSHNREGGAPVLWWRSVGHSHSAHAMEGFVDELAAVAGRDPLDFRLELLRDHPRDVAVLKLAAERAGWGGKLGKGRGRGIAWHRPQETSIAMVAEVAVDGSKVRVERIVAAVDVGVAINPDIIRAQVEGAVGFALSSVLRNQITLKSGEVEQRNFDSYEPTRIYEMPEVEVHIVPSRENPTGIGEPGVPCLAPAIANAIYSATGIRLRSLPLALSSLT